MDSLDQARLLERNPTLPVSQPRALGWPLMLAAVARSYPGRGLRGNRCRLKFLWKLAAERGSVSRWLAREENAAIRRRIEDEPELLGFCVWPFIHAGWSVGRRFGVLLRHEDIVSHTLPHLALGPEERWLIPFGGDWEPNLRLELDRSRWFFREGSLVLHVALGDHRLMSLAFSLDHESGRLVAYVGAIQGSGHPDARDIYRHLTKQLHGLRPRDFTVRAFQYLAAGMGVSRIYAVDSAHRHWQHPYFSERARARVRLDYDEIWRENGGRPRRSGFYELPVAHVPRMPRDVPVRKRAMYRRRQEMLTRLQHELRLQLLLRSFTVRPRGAAGRQGAALTATRATASGPSP